jgi:hypothetical protein
MQNAVAALSEAAESIQISQQLPKASLSFGCFSLALPKGVDIDLIDGGA